MELLGQNRNHVMQTSQLIRVFHPVQSVTKAFGNGLIGSIVIASLMVSSVVHAQEDSGDTLIPILSEELSRIWEVVSTGDEPAHWLNLSVIDRRVLETQATHGASSAISEYHTRLADIDIRVGSPELDNTHKIRDAGWFSEEPRPVIDMPVHEQRPLPIRMAIWRAADTAYRSAVRRLIKVRTNEAVKVDREDSSADFSHAESVVDLGPIEPLAIDGPYWKDTVERLSEVFVEYSSVYDSNVTFRVQQDVHYIQNSEGTNIRFQRNRVRLSMWAATIADDGMELQVADYIDTIHPDRLPDIDTLLEQAHHMGARLSDLRNAPLVEPYAGPAILRGRAAAVFFHEILGHRVEGHRQKDEDEGQTLTDKIDEQIFPRFISVRDDPTVSRWQDVDLNGAYPYDDEGVVAQPVSIVDRGVFRNFLMSRSPIEGFSQSNGHGRRQPGSAVVARQGNLIVEADNSVPYRDLRAQLIGEIRRQGKPFGLIFDDITGGFTFTGRSTPNSYSVKPVTVWRVYADGRPDELVRGVDMIGTPLTTFSRILAASDTYQVFNGMCGAESGWVPVSAIAPDLLIEEVEIQRKEKGNDRPPLLPAPTPSVEGGS